MIRNFVVVGTLAIGAAFALGFYTGWKTTLRVVDNVIARRRESLQN